MSNEWRDPTIIDDFNETYDLPRPVKQKAGIVASFALPVILIIGFILLRVYGG